VRALDTLTDQELIRRYKAGDHDAWGQLWGRYAKAVEGQILAQLDGDSWLPEIVDEAWRRIRADVDRHAEPAHTVGAIVRLNAGRAFLDHLRKMKHEPRPVRCLDEDWTLDEVLERLMLRGEIATGPDRETAESRTLLAAVAMAALKTGCEPHQVLVFLYVKICGLRPRWMAANLLDHSLRFLADHQRELLLAQFAGMEERLRDALRQWSGRLSPEVLRARLRDYVPAQAEPAQKIVHWWHTVKRRLYADIGWNAKQGPGGWRELLAKQVGREEAGDTEANAAEVNTGENRRAEAT
jgi:hypothetical protein